MVSYWITYTSENGVLHSIHTQKVSRNFIFILAIFGPMRKTNTRCSWALSFGVNEQKQLLSWLSYMCNVCDDKRCKCQLRHRIDVCMVCVSRMVNAWTPGQCSHLIRSFQPEIILWIHTTCLRMKFNLSDWLSVSWSLNTFPLGDRRRQLLNRNYSLPHERFSGHVEFPTSKRWYWHKRVRRVHAMFIASLVHHNGYDTMCNVHMCILCVQRKVTRPKAECVAAQCAMEVARCKTGTKHQSQSLNWNLKVLRWQYLLVLYALVFTLLSA